MLISYNWVKEYVALPPIDALSKALTMSGTEVEGFTSVGLNVTGVITAEVKSVAQHPNADRLSLCEVNTGKGVLSIVCGAKNMKAGDKVALAVEGAELPGGFKIKRSKIRGAESEGMLCSEVELGIKDTSNGIMILPVDAPLGMNLVDYLAINDIMLELNITPNRADLLSARGAGREVGAITGAVFTDKNFTVNEEGPEISSLVNVKMEDGVPCGRYVARVIQGVKIGPSPDNIKRRLEAHGVRGINNVVDITNYVLLETGQPLHAFDLKKINGAKIEVRGARAGESIETIDCKVRPLETGTLVIADENSPVALAGVMGGKASEVGDGTVDILLEGAWFEPTAVRRSSKKNALSTDSSYRFERGVDIERVTGAIDMAASMINAIAGGKTAKGIIDIYPNRHKPEIIIFKAERAGDIIGVTISIDKLEKIFTTLGITVERGNDGILLCAPPSYRQDIRTEADLIEEAARIHGYDNIPIGMPTAALTLASVPKRTRLARRLRETLVSAGFFEAVNYSFVSHELFTLDSNAEKKGVVILNPLAEDQSVLRDSLIPSLLDTLRRNIQKKNENVSFFEIAPAFMHADGAKLPDERWKVSGVMYGLRDGEGWNRGKEGLDFYDVKGVIEKIFDSVAGKAAFDASPLNSTLLHPGKSAAVVVGNKRIGFFGETHPEIMAKLDLRHPAFLFELDLNELLGLYDAPKKYTPVPRFPSSTRDIALIMDVNIPYRDIINLINGLGEKLIEMVEVFDVYSGGTNMPDGKKSVAIRVVYRNVERTLAGNEVDEAHARVATAAVERFKAEVRGA